ncbi:MAG: A24 family peptidase [Desulfovibrio sp.]|uniref:prepilin peptidase n=1 Tax=Desulfovibrio sp. TaxID=885 RepID=UPI0039E21B9D
MFILQYVQIVMCIVAVCGFLAGRLTHTLVAGPWLYEVASGSSAFSASGVRKRRKSRRTAGRSAYGSTVSDWAAASAAELEQADTVRPERTGMPELHGSLQEKLLSYGCAAGSVLLVWLFLPRWSGLILLPFAWGLLALSMADARFRILPDMLTWPLMALGLAVNCVDAIVPFGQAVIGCVAGYLLLFSFSRLYYALMGREGIGGGDLKLLALLGAWGGWRALPLTLMVSSLCVVLFFLLGLALKGRRREGADVNEGGGHWNWRGARQALKTEIPFGPPLAVAGFGVISYAHYLG